MKGEWIRLKGRGKKYTASVWIYAPTSDMWFYIDNLLVKRVDKKRKYLRKIPATTA